MTVTHRNRTPLALTGIAGQRSTATKAIAAVSIAAGALMLAGCTAGDEGVVRVGADGQKYVVPEDAQRPTYRSQADCIADVTEQIQKLKDSGTAVSDNPADLCESGSNYGGHYGSTWFGPIIWGSSAWQSSRATGWAAVQDGNFAAKGSKLAQPDVVQKAPTGASAGTRAPIKGGFGSGGKVSGGFGHAVGESGGSHGSFGG